MREPVSTPRGHAPDFLRFVRDPEVQTIVSDLVTAREDLPKIEARIAEIVAPVFARFEFWSAGFRGRAPERITDEGKLYLAGPAAFESPAMKAFYKARHEAIVAAGYELPGVDYCPASMAQCRVSDLERVLLERATTLIHPAFAKVAEARSDDRLRTIDRLIAAVRDYNQEKQQS